MEKSLNKTETIARRVLSLPFVAGMGAVMVLVAYVKSMYLYCRYGAEWNQYHSELNQNTIREVYNLVKEQSETTS